MYELWARKRVINGVGGPYEFIESFEDERQIYYMLDKVDRDVYQEAMVSKGNSCIMSVEFPPPMVLKKTMNAKKDYEEEEE